MDSTQSLLVADDAAPRSTTQAPQNWDHLPAYPLDAPDFQLVFPVPWSGSQGRIDVTHLLKRPTPGQFGEYKRQSRSEVTINTKTGEKNEADTLARATRWLWDEVAQSIGGYPGMPDGLTDLTPELRAKVRGMHKERAITYLLAATAEVLELESEVFFDTGRWVVALKIGTRKDAPDYVVKMAFREWTETERQAFEQHARVETEQNQGKLYVTSSYLNLDAFVALFDALFLGVVSGAVVGGQPAAQARPDAVLAALFSEWKMLVVVELAKTWKAYLGD